jgi:DNA (cytosine-5)-methyltransferase 1
LAPAPIWTDLKTFPAQIFRDKVDILTGGYPCQPFSAAGKRAGKDDPRHLWPHIRQHIESIRPVRCFFENVDGHISLGLREVIEDLESLGYATTWGVFSAAEVGAPHQRKRVYILADSDSPRQQQSNKEDAGRSSKQPDGGGLRSRAISDSDSRSRGRRSDRSAKGNRESELHGTEGALSKNVFRYCTWEFEPRLGRVVDGCANRVDRLRLLGNGVVPQTAAKAWSVLNQQISM